MLLHTMVTIPAGQMSTTAMLMIIADKVSYADTGPNWPLGSIDSYSREADELNLLASHYSACTDDGGRRNGHPDS
jgi:hypothetical protein